MSRKRKSIKRQCIDCRNKLMSPDWNNSKPVFSLIYLSKKYSIEQCTKEEKIAFVQAITKFSSLTWTEILYAPKHGLGSESISQQAIKGDSIPKDIVTDDTKLIALRFSGKAPMVGFRDQNVFHIIWFDRNFDLYDHN